MPPTTTGPLLPPLGAIGTSPLEPTYTGGGTDGSGAPATVTRGGGQAAESALLAQAIPAGAVLVLLDERGRTLDSPEFAARLRRWADGGTRDLAFAIGGADGHAPALRDRADLLLSFGPMVWPHMLARVMLAEQLYRAASILSGGPYHRGG